MLCQCHSLWLRQQYQDHSWQPRELMKFFLMSLGRRWWKSWIWGYFWYEEFPFIRGHNVRAFYFNRDIQWDHWESLKKRRLLIQKFSIRNASIVKTRLKVNVFIKLFIIFCLVLFWIPNYWLLSHFYKYT